MSLILDGSNGLSDVDGTAATPAIRGTDANTGIFFPAADTIAFSEGGVEAARFDASGNLGVGTSSPAQKLDVNGSVKSTGFYIGATGTSGFVALGTTGSATDGGNFVGRSATSTFNAGGVEVYAGGAERMRIDSSGNVYVGTTSSNPVASRVNGAVISSNGSIQSRSPSAFSYYGLNVTSGTHISFYTDNGSAFVAAGAITSNGATTSYFTGSDYRMKENIAPMTGALGVVQQLKPVTYQWKDAFAGTQKNGQGFIAHELAQVIPEAVTGEKDAVETIDDVDADGKVIGTKEVPKYQGIDTSFLVATLTAAIQELKVELDSVKTELATLKASQ
jgi:hypothetical protein